MQKKISRIRFFNQTNTGNPVKFGASGVTRTPDLLITNQLLYRLSYTSKYNLFYGLPQ